MYYKDSHNVAGWLSERQTYEQLVKSKQNFDPKDDQTIAVSVDKDNVPIADDKKRHVVEADFMGSMYSPGKILWTRHLIILSQFLILVLGSILLVRAVDLCPIMWRHYWMQE